MNKSSAPTGTPTSRIIFLHSPKTAGMTLTRLFDKNCSDRRALNTELGNVESPAIWDRLVSHLREMPQKQRDQYDIIRGHMYFGLHELFTGPTDYVTFLRDPLKRVTSHFRMLRRNGHIPPTLVLDPSKPNWNLGAHANFRHSLDNGQTRALAGSDMNLPLGACSEEHLRRAQANIRAHFRFVGMTEQFNLGYLILKRMYGWKWRFYVPKNVAPSSDGFRFSPRTLGAIRELNRFDLELYRTAQESFQELVRSHGFGLKAERKLFLMGNYLHGRLHVLRRNVKAALGVKPAPAQLVMPQA
jgi:hypothetical protein